MLELFLQGLKPWVSLDVVFLLESCSYRAGTKRIFYASVRGGKVYRDNNNKNLTITFTHKFTDRLSQSNKTLIFTLCT